MQYGLTKREQDTLNFLEFYLSGTNGKIGPTYDEIRVALNLKSKSGIHRLLDSLEHKGWISRPPMKARAIQIVKPGQSEPCDETL